MDQKHITNINHSIESLSMMLIWSNYDYFDNILLNTQFVLREDFSTQYYLIVTIEKWRQNLGKGDPCGALWTDLSKASDFIVHDFLIEATILHIKY